VKHIYHCLISKRLKSKKMDTPRKKLERYSMTHEEEEEMQHDILKLRDQVQQISLS